MFGVCPSVVFISFVFDVLLSYGTCLYLLCSRGPKNCNVHDVGFFILVTAFINDAYSLTRRCNVTWNRNIVQETHLPVHEQDVECLGEFTHVYCIGPIITCIKYLANMFRPILTAIEHSRERKQIGLGLIKTGWVLLRHP